MKYWNETPVLAAGYLRLSRDDGDKLESDSIRSQRSLIEEFVNHHSEITWVGEYVDDGYSGTNFERPAFKRMMEDVKNKKVNCIMVKDLSRFGRNYIETGRYLEKLFPILGVRFIAINDSYDSAQQKDDVEQILVPFKNLLNDAYCRDISIKIRSQLEVKRKNGQFIGSFASYGYEKDPEDKNHLIVDEHAAETIRLIFNLKVEGRSSRHIAARLNELGIPAPMEYKKQQGLKFDNGRAGEERGGWRPGAVDRILRNELYTGTMVQGKSRKINYKVKNAGSWNRPIGSVCQIPTMRLFRRNCLKRFRNFCRWTSGPRRAEAASICFPACCVAAAAGRTWCGGQRGRPEKNTAIIIAPPTKRGRAAAPTSSGRTVWRIPYGMQSGSEFLMWAGWKSIWRKPGGVWRACGPVRLGRGGRMVLQRRLNIIRSCG